MPELTLEDYLSQIRTHPDADVRRNAAWVLGRQRDPRILPALMAAVNDADSSVRLRVAESLGVWRDESVTSALLRLLQDADSDVRAQAAQSLGQGEHHSALAALLAAVNDPEDEVRATAIEALGKLADAEAAPTLGLALTDDDSLIRFQALQSLLLLPAEATQSALLALLPTVEAARLPPLLETLGRIGSTETFDLISAFSTHPDEAVQGAAEWAMEQIKARST